LGKRKNVGSEALRTESYAASVPRQISLYNQTLETSSQVHVRPRQRFGKFSDAVVFVEEQAPGQALGELLYGWPCLTFHNISFALEIGAKR
jgi:hypothetical protein